MNPTIAELQSKYAGVLEITGNNGWLGIRTLEPVYAEHPSIDGPAFLHYSIALDDHRPGITFEDRARNVWLRDENGIGFQSVQYGGGLGICTISEYRGQGPIPELLLI